MKNSSLLLFVIVLALNGCAQGKSQNDQKQKQKVGASCEGCEAIYESPKPFADLEYVTTLPDYNEPGSKLEVSGIVYKRDGKTPAKDVVIYVYHTNQKGRYATKGDEKGWGRRHGYLRGWMKTNKNGEYRFYTLRPASYPNSTNPQHIHVTIKEPGKNEYYIDDYEFADDPLIGKKDESRKAICGSGLLKVQYKNGVQVATRHIILGLNVQDYPTGKQDGNMKSGLAVGSNCPAFDPLHLSGADAGKKVCPMCKYGRGQGIMIWFNHANLDQMKTFVIKLENEMMARGEKNFRVFLMYMNPYYVKLKDEENILQGKIKKWCAEQKLVKVAMTWVPSPVDEETCGLYQLNPEAKNTVFIYKKRGITEKWVNIDYSNASLKEILKPFSNSNDRRVFFTKKLFTMMPYNRFK